MPKNPPPYESPPDSFEVLRDSLMGKIIKLRGEVKELGEYSKIFTLANLHVLVDKASKGDELLTAWVGIHRVARDIRSKSIL